MTKDEGGTADDKKGITLTGEQFKRLSNIWQAKDMSRAVKASLLLQSGQAARLESCGGEKIVFFQTKYPRRIFKIRWQQHIPNKAVLVFLWFPSFLPVVFLPSFVVQAFLRKNYTYYAKISIIWIFINIQKPN